MTRQHNLYIPKIIHQIWIGPKPRPEKWMDSWRLKHPDWEYKLWTEENLPKLRNQDQFDKIDTYQGKADILRYELLYEYGGIYIDADCECINTLDDYIRKFHLFVLYENEYFFPGLLTNTAMGSEPKHALLANFINHISQIEDINHSGAWITVGPQMITRLIRQYELFNEPIKKLASYKFLPLHHTRWKYEGKGKVYATHHWNDFTSLYPYYKALNFDFKGPKSSKEET